MKEILTEISNTPSDEQIIEKIKDNWNAGADLVILGDVFERDVKQGIKIISDLASMKDKAEQSF